MIVATEIQELKDKLQKGDIKEIADALKLSRQTVYNVFWGKHKNSRVSKALALVAQIREQQAEQQITNLKERILENAQ